jgi:hypothetical protein
MPKNGMLANEGESIYGRSKLTGTHPDRTFGVLAAFVG